MDDLYDKKCDEVGPDVGAKNDGMNNQGNNLKNKSIILPEMISYWNVYLNDEFI